MTAQNADGRALHAVPEVATEKLTIAQAVRDAMLEEMDRDDRVIVLGEDVGVDGGVFRATEGLNRDQVGIASLAPGEGLVGLVAEREEPVNLENAENHPSFQFLPDLGEERYHAFLGVPIIHQRDVLGVLIVQQTDRRRFDDRGRRRAPSPECQHGGDVSQAAQDKTRHYVRRRIGPSGRGMV